MKDISKDRIALVIIAITWFSITFSFIIGPILSHLLLIISFALVIIISGSVVKGLSYLYLMITSLIFFNLLAMVLYYSNDNSIIYSLYYIRGGILLFIIFELAKFNLKKLLDTLVILSAITSILLLQAITFKFLYASWSLFYLIPESLLERQYSGFVGFFNNPNYWSIFAFLNFSLILYTIKNSSKMYNSHRYFFVLVTLISLYSIIMTGSRMGMLLAFLSVILCINLKSLKSYYVIIVITSLTFLVINYIANFQIDMDLSSIDKALVRFERLLNSASEEDRFIRASRYLDLLLSSFQNFLFGIGLGTNIGSGSPHNSFILIIRDFGVLGLFLFVSFYIYTICKGLRNCTRNTQYLFRLLCVSIPIIMISNDIIDSRPFWLILGIYLAIVFVKEKECHD